MIKVHNVYMWRFCASLSFTLQTRHQTGRLGQLRYQREAVSCCVIAKFEIIERAIVTSITEIMHNAICTCCHSSQSKGSIISDQLSNNDNSVQIWHNTTVPLITGTMIQLTSDILPSTMNPVESTLLKSLIKFRQYMVQALEGSATSPFQ